MRQTSPVATFDGLKLQPGAPLASPIISLCSLESRIAWSSIWRKEASEEEVEEALLCLVSFRRTLLLFLHGTLETRRKRLVGKKPFLLWSSVRTDFPLGLQDITKYSVSGQYPFLQSLCKRYEECRKNQRDIFRYPYSQTKFL